MISKKLPTTLMIVACLGLAACSDKSPEPAPGPTQPAPDAAPAVATPTDVQAALGPWTGDFSEAVKIELCALDSINGAVAIDGRFEAPANQPAVFEGWASTPNLEPAKTFTLVLDGQSDFAVTGSTGIPREDVAKAYSKPALANAGFRVEVPALALPAGDYGITLVYEDNGQPVACSARLTLTAR